MAESRVLWESKAARLARQVNAGWFLQRWLQIAVPFFAVAACAILFARYRGWDPGRDEVMTGLFGALALTLVAGWFAARARFVTKDVALVRLESKLGLNSALSAADAGVTLWPDDPGEEAEGQARYQWVWARLLLPGFLAMATLAAALLLPLTSRSAIAAGAEEPAAWKQMEEWLETLEEEEIVEPDSAEEVREQIDTLRDRPEDEWFSHSSLEAGDSLKESLEKTIQSMGQSLEMAEQSLAALEAAGGGAAQEGMRKELAEQFEEAMQQLQGSSLKLDSNLMDQLANLDPSQLQALSPEQMKELQERLRKSAGT